MEPGQSLSSKGMTESPMKKTLILLLLAALLFLGLAAAALAQDTAAISGNLVDLTGAAVTSDTFVRFTLANCGRNTPRVNGTGILDQAVKDFTPDGAGAFSGTLYRNDRIECGGVTGSTRYVATIYRAKALLWPGHRYNIAAATFDLNTAPPETAIPPSTAGDYALRNASNTFTGGTQSFEAAAVTRPFRRLAFASFPASCTANREFIERSDPATAGQVIYVCNSTGNGWDLVGDGGAGGGGAVSSVFGRVGAVVAQAGDYSKSDVGLGSADNTSDAAKPISTATQTALDAKVAANTAITGATKTKITYDAKGLVTAGADAQFSDIGGTVGAAQLPNPGATTLGGVKSLTCGGTDKLSAIGTDGLPVCTADQTGGGSSHAILSATHPDTVAASVVLGDLMAGNSTPAWQRIAGNTTTSKRYLSQTGNGSISALPAWASIAEADVANLTSDLAAKAVTSTTLTAGAGLSGGGDLSAGRSFATDSTEADFLASGALTCGAATQGEMKVHTTPLQYCDNAATPTLRYSAYADSAGKASSAAAADAIPWGGVSGTPTTVSGYGITDAVTTARTVSTSSPLTGGGALSSNLTLACATCEVTGNKDAASGYAGLTAGTKLKLAQGQEVWALADLTDVSATTGAGSTAMLNQAPVLKSYTVAGLPVAGTADRIAIVTDASTAGSCTSGGGAARAFCRDTGSAWEPLGDGGGGGGNHNFLSATHSDTVASSPVRGGLVVANVTPAWAQLALGGSGLYPKSNGSDLVYSTLAAAGVGACGASTWVSTLNGDAAPTCTQPAFSSLSGSATDGQLSANVALYNNGSKTWLGGTDSTWTFDTTGGTSPVISFTAGNINISTGGLQIGGAAVGALNTAGSNGIAFFNAGDDTTAARSDHTHRVFHTLTWFFPGTPATGVQAFILAAPMGLTSATITDMTVSVATTSASTSTFNIQRCTGSCTGTTPTFANIYSSNNTLSANTSNASFGTTNLTTTIAAGDQFKANLVTIGASLANVTITMTFKDETVN
jgi:hypothetical protein